MKLKLPYPVSANRYWKTRAVKNFAQTYLSAEARDYRRQVMRIAADFRAVQGDVSIGLVLAPKLTKKNEASKVLMDLDNSIKVTLDALIGVVYVDDKQVKRITAEYGQPEVGGALYVTVKEMECLSE
ncbi:RusA family crossover junction endodeoxyribonuclease [Advenella sp. WQ 585]|uniref:RusA family crossover junction endodeoxyribonuclease n=1 Tax=Advenella mandrilli TaxID=2800330 RepID=A0ABS1EAM8_9BURK|nr:RusA family crossover junction endodeoxyribonuclease [Advenella mandrilli]MBK1780576.1 RusA family crossover junction endodeoxyribonuclease [Advenella mandrilli]